MLYIHKNNQLLIYCESTSPKQRSKIINLDGNNNHKPTLFLEKFSAIQDGSLGNILETDLFEECLFLNEKGNTVKIMAGYSLEDRMKSPNANNSSVQTKSFTVKQGIKELKVISENEILVLTPDGGLIIFNDKGQEICNLKNLMSKKQKEDGWKIRGMELCPEQKFISVVSYRNVPTKQGLEKEYDRFLVVSVDRDMQTENIFRLTKIFSVKMQSGHCKKAKVSIPFYHFNCPVISVVEEKDMTRFYFYIYSNGKCQRLGN